MDKAAYHMRLRDLDPKDDLLIGELTATFVVAANRELEEITPDSDIANGIRAVVKVLSRK